MLLLVKSKISDKDLKKAAQDLDGYIKVVVDIDQEILTAGGKLHVEGEKLLLDNGSQQANLWGGGLDLETLGVDYDSMINIRPNQGNTSREILDSSIRTKVTKIVHELLK